jgi:hypothetical protein
MSAPSTPLTGRLLEAVTDAIVRPQQPCHQRVPLTATTMMLVGDLLACAPEGPAAERDVRP